MADETVLTTAAAGEAATTAPAPAAPATPAPAGAAPAEVKDAPASSKDAEGDKDKAGAPEKYEFKLPEGVELNEALVKDFEPLARELKLSQEGAQKLVDLYIKASTDAVKATTDYWQNLQTEWTNTTKADKEYGGVNLNANIAIAKKAIEAFGAPELTAALNATGVGNHPEVVRFFYRVGKAVADDKVTFGKPASAPRDPAKILFPNQN